MTRNRRPKPSWQLLGRSYALTYLKDVLGDSSGQNFSPESRQAFLDAIQTMATTGLGDDKLAASHAMILIGARLARKGKP